MNQNNQESELIHYLGYISSRISTLDTTEQLVKELSKIIEELVSVQYTAIYLWNPNINKLELLQAKGFSEVDRKNAEDSVMTRHPGWVFKNKQLFHVPDTFLDDGQISKTGKRSFIVRSRLFVPILSGDKCMGTIGFASGTPNMFNDRHINVIKFIANLSGTVYSNILLKASEKEYQKQLEKALEESEKAKLHQQTFFAKMSHELRTPMNAIIGMSELIKDSNLNSTQSKYINAISVSSQTLLSIINDILDISKIQSDKFTLEFIPFNLYNLIDNVLHSFHFKETDSLKFIQQVSPNIPNLIGDPLRLQQVLVNLLNNATKFTKEGNITLSIKPTKTNRNKTTLRFSVKDTGKGIEKKNLKTIFDSFKQENEGITRKYGGSGLGLTISKEIINLYNSEIHVKSKVNVGTEFYFDLNFQNAKEENTISKPKSKQYDLSNLNVLIVEDNQINQIYAESVIRSFKANSKVAENGKVAIDILKEYNFSIILMDMQMPVMDGIETTKWIREKLNSKIPIIGLSANTVQGDIDLCTEVGMNSYLSKPFTPKALNEAIGKVLSLDEIPEIKERKVNKSVAKNKKFDLDTLLQHTNNNQVLINKMLEIFISETPIELSKIKSSFIENNYKDLAEIAHKIKPNFKYLGIEIGFELALKLEKNNGDKEVISNNIKQLDKLTKEILPLLKKEIKNK